MTDDELELKVLERYVARFAEAERAAFALRGWGKYPEKPHRNSAKNAAPKSLISSRLLKVPRVALFIERRPSGMRNRRTGRGTGRLKAAARQRPR